MHNALSRTAALALTCALGACAVEAQPSSSAGEAPSSSASAALTTVEASDATRAETGIDRFVVDGAGHTEARAADGAVVATFDVTKEDGASVLRVASRGRSAEVRYTVTKTAGGLRVAGTAGGKPFAASFGEDGRPQGGAAPASLDPELARVLHAFDRDLATYAQAHTRKGCALAGLGVIVSALTLEPWGIGLGFIGVVAECGD